MALQAANKKAQHYNIKTFSLKALLVKNEEFKNNFRNNLLFKLMKSRHFSKSENKNKMLDYFQTWSTYFQQMMFLKTAFCQDPVFVPLFRKHFEEEYGHDKILSQERNHRLPQTDAILEAICNWFPSKILSFTPYEQLVLVNLCLEASSVIFHEYAIPALDPKRELSYLQLHQEVDISHEEMGNHLLEGLTEIQYKRLLDIQEISWNMIEALMHRIAELTVKP
ncbi:hypothetical protein [Candidatus Odyssella acanthamoebae]|uniref:Iron-containing redox enzyme family protein n=1 Tax=Candidatus Odyssella acanthamoebae TaxID=91604 RepID=A0A077AR95_9PROT|nr:hypothetical protein [Candidatus Paracaedibacter acanthamoebae]AIK95707.1 hypothetical protein ID47_01570 [Candidatus Paracaedibacter acanthamoebae]